MLYMIGLGLGSSKDITLRGVELMKKADIVYLEQYTSLLCDEKNINDLCKSFDKPLISANREMVENDPNEILENAKTKNVAFLVAGDVFGATTHIDLVIRSKELNIEIEVVHNASILTAVGCCGLQLYRFGEIVSIPLWADTWKPTSYLDKINENLKRGLHTLCLLDIKVGEKSIEAMMKGKTVYEPARFMTVDIAAKQLIESIELSTIDSKNLKLNKDSLCVGLARVGSLTQQIRASSLNEMTKVDLGAPLHSLIIAGELHDLEDKMMNLFRKA